MSTSLPPLVQPSDVNDCSDGDSDISSEYPFSVTSTGASSRTSSSSRVCPMTSSISAQAYTLQHDNDSHVYCRPADGEEFERLQSQHLMFREVLGKYLPILADVMEDNIPGEVKACLDLGCGSGGWIMEVAHDFPNCSAVAVDLVPMQSTSMPANLRSEVDDINLGLEHFYGGFNVVNARLISPGIKDFPRLIDQISRVLRPGGLISLAELDFRVHDSNKQPFDVDTNTLEPPWWPRWLEFTNVAIRKRGGSTDVASNLVSWVSEHEAFENIVHQEYWIPVTPCIPGEDPESVQQRRIGKLVRDDITAFLKSGRLLLLDSGLSESLVNQLQENIAIELAEATSPQYIRLQAVSALKKRPVVGKKLHGAPAGNPHLL